MKRMLLVFAVFGLAIQFVFSQDGILGTQAGTGNYMDSGDDSPAINAGLKSAVAVLGLSDGGYLIVDNDAGRVRKVDSQGVITAFAGTGIPGYSGDDGPAVSAALNSPSDIARDSLGNTYIADAGNQAIRFVDSSGLIHTLGVGEYVLSYPRGLAVDSNNSVYVADQTAGVILKIDVTEIVTRAAGNPEKNGADEGDGGPAVDAGLTEPGDVAVASDGTLYILEMGRHRIRKVDTLGIISVFAGTGNWGYSGDGGLAQNAEFYFDAEQSSKLELASTKLFVSDSGNHVIRCIDLSTNIIETVSGNGLPGFAGDNEWAVDGEHLFPYGIGCFPNGDLIVGDSGNSRVRKVTTSFSAPTGANSTVSIGDEAALNFKNVTSAGSVTIDVRDNFDPPVPGDFQVSGGRYFDINTDASFSGNLILTLAYDDADPVNEVEDLDNKILHYDGAIWNDVTTEVRPSEDQVDGRVNSLSPFVLVKPVQIPEVLRFTRGNPNFDSDIDISDAVYILLDLFAEGFNSTCPDAEDVNDDGEVNITDPIVLLNYLFKGGPAPPPPGPGVDGYDHSEDSLSCVPQ